AAGAVERHLLVDVAHDLVLGQRAEAYLGRHAVYETRAGVRVYDGQRGMEYDGLAAHAAQLRARALDRAGLAEDLGADVRDLIGADHERVVVAGGDRERLLQREAVGRRVRRLAGQRGLVDLGAGGFERDAQAFEQHAAVGGGRGED